MGRGEIKNCTPLWREARFEVKMCKTRQLRTTFRSYDVQKLARRCGEKRILKSKCTKHVSFGPLLQVTMSKKCTLLWREVHFQLKMYKTRQLRTTFCRSDVEKLHAAVARSAFSTENAKKLGGVGTLFEVEMLKNCTPLWREAHFEVKMYKTRQLRTTFRSYNVEKLHAAVARSTF